MCGAPLDEDGNKTCDCSDFDGGGQQVEYDSHRERVRRERLEKQQKINDEKKKDQEHINPQPSTDTQFGKPR